MCRRQHQSGGGTSAAVGPASRPRRPYVNVSVGRAGTTAVLRVFGGPLGGRAAQPLGAISTPPFTWTGAACKVRRPVVARHHAWKKALVWPMIGQTSAFFRASVAIDAPVPPCASRWMTGARTPRAREVLFGGGQAASPPEASRPRLTGSGTRVPRRLCLSSRLSGSHLAAPHG